MSVFLFVVPTNTVALLEHVAGADGLMQIAIPKTRDEAKWDGGSNGKGCKDCLQH